MPRPRRKETPIRKILVSRMTEKKMGVREAARIAKVSPSTISGWRSGAVPDDFAAVRRLAEALGISLSFLLTGEDDSRRRAPPPCLAEVFQDGEVVFDGYAKIVIQRLVPRNES